MSQDVYLAVNYAYFGPSSNEKKFLCVCRFTRDVLALVGCHGDLRSLVGWTDFPKRFPNEFAAYARSIDLGSGPRALCVGPLDLHGSQKYREILVSDPEETLEIEMLHELPSAKGDGQAMVANLFSDGRLIPRSIGYKSEKAPIH